MSSVGEYQVRTYEGPLPRRSRRPPERRALNRPCANCARMVVASGSSAVYCSDLCSQTTGFVRYYRRKADAGELHDPDIHEALNTQIAMIAGGGYPARERALAVEVRAAVIERDDGKCRLCGAPGTEVDHIAGSSSALENLQLLCRECHREKTKAVLAKASEEVLNLVHRPMLIRVNWFEPTQPSDDVNWDHRRWARDLAAVEQDLALRWIEWWVGEGSQPIDPGLAVAGFPPHLEPWAWYADGS